MKRSRFSEEQIIGVDEILFVLEMGGVPRSGIVETVRNIGTRVIPHFRTLAKGVE